jgi:LMBR1 domain-containing protein 1
LSLLPLNMIKGRRRIDAESEDVENRLTASRERQRVLRSKYMNRSIPNREQRELEELEDEERFVLHTISIRIDMFCQNPV